jgi:hypothetical protein
MCPMTDRQKAAAGSVEGETDLSFARYTRSTPTIRKPSSAVVLGIRSAALFVI